MQNLARVGGRFVFTWEWVNWLKLLQNLLKGGLPPDKPAAIVSQGTLPSQRKVVTTLEEIVKDAKKAKLEAPAIIFVGNSSWFNHSNKIGLKIAHYLESELW